MWTLDRHSMAAPSRLAPTPRHYHLHVHRAGSLRIGRRNQPSNQRRCFALGLEVAQLASAVRGPQGCRGIVAVPLKCSDASCRSPVAILALVVRTLLDIGPAATAPFPKGTFRTTVKFAKRVTTGALCLTCQHFAAQSSQSGLIYWPPLAGTFRSSRVA